PDHARDPHSYRDERQIRRDSAEQGPLVAPTGKQPETSHQEEVRRNRQRIADVHGAHKIALLALELEAAYRTALIHREPAPKHRAAIDSALAATGTALAQNRDGDAGRSWLSVVRGWHSQFPPHRNMDQPSVVDPQQDQSMRTRVTKN